MEGLLSAKDFLDDVNVDEKIIVYISDGESGMNQSEIDFLSTFTVIAIGVG